MPIFMVVDDVEVDKQLWNGTPSADQLSTLVDVSDIPVAVFRRVEKTGESQVVMFHLPGVLCADKLDSVDVANALKDGHLVVAACGKQQTRGDGKGFCTMIGFRWAPQDAR